MYTDRVLNILKKHGQLLDLEIASATKTSIAKVRTSLADLSARGEVFQCRVQRFDGDKRIDCFQCRISGYTPPAAAGRKASPSKQG